MKKSVVVLLSVSLAVFLLSCSKETPDAKVSLAFSAVDLLVGEECPVLLKDGGNVVDAVSSAPSVVSVSDSKPVLVAGSAGTAVITVTDGSGAKGRMTVNVLDPERMCHEIKSEDVFLSGIRLHFSTVLQGFDLDLKGRMVYFNQNGGGDWKHLNLLSRCQFSSSKADTGMELPYYGHGQGLNVEPSLGVHFSCWLPAHGTMDTDGSYRMAQSIARLTYSNGAKDPAMESCYCLPGLCNLQVSLDVPNDVAMVYGIPCETQDKPMLRGYSLSAMKSLPVSDVTLPMQRNVAGRMVSSTIKARDLSSLQAVFSLELPSKLFNVQAYTYKNGKIYVLAGVPEELAADAEWINHAQLFIFNTAGALLKEMVLDDYIRDASVKAALSSDLGYFEPEGLQVYDGCLYIGYASRITEDGVQIRKPAILKYNLAE